MMYVDGAIGMGFEAVAVPATKVELCSFPSPLPRKLEKLRGETLCLSLRLNCCSVSIVKVLA
jgi:hypothetical protein